MLRRGNRDHGRDEEDEPALVAGVVEQQLHGPERDPSGEQPFGRLTLRLVRGDEVLSELVANPDKLNEGEAPPDWARWLSMTGILAVTPFHATRTCRLRVLAETEAGIIESGQFLIDRMHG